ncbi:hypothetical protein ASF30_00140 [Leifsonia sp. Leaf264]|nr:hypothetical protein ASF30_00140 [Leifsonia sp. Leaf264]
MFVAAGEDIDDGAPGLGDPFTMRTQRRDCGISISVPRLTMPMLMHVRGIVLRGNARHSSIVARRPAAVYVECTPHRLRPSPGATWSQ